MSGRLLLYGAYGFSGRRLAAGLADLGERLILAGRDRARLEPLAQALGLPFRVFALDDPEALDAGLADVSVVLHAAGPFTRTSAPMIAACLRACADYLDLAGEWPVFEQAVICGPAAARAGIMLMPGVGFSVAASDCLLAMAMTAAPETVKLRLGVSAPHRMSSGSVRTALSLNDRHVRVRRNGQLATLPAGGLAHNFDFGAGYQMAVAVTWPDVITGAVSTGVADIETYSGSFPAARAAYALAGAAAPITRTAWAKAALERVCDLWPDPPEDREMPAGDFTLVVEAIDPWRRATHLRLRTRDGYTVTTATAAAAVRAVLGGRRRVGFQTPSRVFGARFILSLGCAELDARVTGPARV